MTGGTLCFRVVRPSIRQFAHPSHFMGTTSIKSYDLIMHALQCLHDVDVHRIFCFDLDPHLTCFCFVHITNMFNLELRVQDIPVMTKPFFTVCRPLEISQEIDKEFCLLLKYLDLVG